MKVIHLFQIKKASKLKGSLEFTHSKVPSPDCTGQSPGTFSSPIQSNCIRISGGRAQTLVIFKALPVVLMYSQAFELLQSGKSTSNEILRYLTSSVNFSTDGDRRACLRSSGHCQISLIARKLLS